MSEGRVDPERQIAGSKADEGSEKFSGTSQAPTPSLEAQSIAIPAGRPGGWRERRRKVVEVRECVQAAVKEKEREKKEGKTPSVMTRVGSSWIMGCVSAARGDI
jgi:hypothetical protein